MITVKFITKNDTINIELSDETNIYATIADLKTVDLNGINSYQINFVDETQEEIYGLVEIWNKIKSIDFNNLQKIEFFVNGKLYRTITDKVISYNLEESFQSLFSRGIKWFSLYIFLITSVGYCPNILKNNAPIVNIFVLESIVAFNWYSSGAFIRLVPQ